MFYGAQVVSIFEYLQSKEIVYRDLKPENVLIEEDGYLAVTDFGLAKVLDEGEVATTFAGTPDYLAPEIIKSEEYAFPVDWWTLGVLTYELVVGMSPFFTRENRNVLFKNILQRPIMYPNAQKHGIAMSEELKDFINKCLDRDPSKRLGSNGGPDEILNHPWFSDIDQEAILAKKIEPEFKPELSDDVCDVSQFDAYFTNEEVAESVVPAKAQRIINKHQDAFEGFDTQ